MPEEAYTNAVIWSDNVMNNPMPGRLHGKTALITGGGRGIGRGIALRFAREGAAVAIVQRDERSAGTTVAAVVAAGGAAFTPGTTDVSVPEQVARAVSATIARFGQIDILINNAAIAGANGPFLNMTFSAWQQIVNVNLSGMFLCGQAVARHMAEQGIRGRIVNVGSVNSFAAEREAAAYVAAKHGVLGLTRAMAVDLASYGITVNCLAPGPITVERNAAVFASLQEQIGAGVPLGRPGTIEETAAAAVFLASDEASYITGATLVMDGGMLAYLR